MTHVGLVHFRLEYENLFFFFSSGNPNDHNVSSYKCFNKSVDFQGLKPRPRRLPVYWPTSRDRAKRHSRPTKRLQTTERH